MYFNAAAVLNGDSVSKQGKNYDPQVYIVEYKCIGLENQNCSKLINSDNDGFFEA